MADTYDVVVIGYGPVGQMLSTQLAQAGHTVATFERQPALYGLSRAGHVDDEIMRTLQKVGAGEEFREDAVSWALYDMRTKAFGGDLLLSLDWSYVGPHGFQSHSIFYQNNLELALNRQAEAAGVAIHMNTEVRSFDQDEDGVSVTVFDRAAETETTVKARYLVAADGANSFVRRELGITTTKGMDGPYQLVVDTLQKRELTFEFDNGQFADPERPGCLFQLGKTHRRWEFTLLPEEEPEDFTIDKVWELLAPWVTPEDVEVLRYPVYRFTESMTDEWSRGRIFLVGDAAHILWPFAGEGMCNGIRDASTLAWRLDLVLRGVADPALLESYEDDRKPNMQAWTDMSREIGLPCIITDPEIAAQRDAGFKAVAADPSLAPPIPVIPGPVAFSKPGDPVAGQVALNVEVTAGERTGLLDDVVGAGWHLITNDTAAVASLSAQQREQLAAVGVKLVVLSGEGQDTSALGEGATAVLSSGLGEWLTGIGQAAVLARPDFYLYGGAATGEQVGDLVDTFLDALHTGRSQDGDAERGRGTANDGSAGPTAAAAAATSAGSAVADAEPVGV